MEFEFHEASFPLEIFIYNQNVSVLVLTCLV